MKFHFVQTIVFVLLLIPGSSTYSQEKQVKDSIHFFPGSWREAVAKAKTEKKHIFLDAYASWCVPCKTMEREVYTDRKVAKYFNANFISIKIDMEKGEAPDLSKRFTSIDGYPSLLFFD